MNTPSLATSSTGSEAGERELPRRERQKNTKITFNFKDVEDTIRLFDGNDYYTIERWISDFEELATLFQWNDIQKLVFDRKSLKGVAKTFVQGLSTVE